MHELQVYCYIISTFLHLRFFVFKALTDCSFIQGEREEDRDGGKKVLSFLATSKLCKNHLSTPFVTANLDAASSSDGVTQITRNRAG